ncbi:MAG: peptidylprolyl isomerase, partial [Verrucomicrobiota bacterium]|nr:peptidylprolyl isomerase [Verrucomicrobiota bacterium]
TKTAPDPTLKSNPQLTSAAFELTPQDPNSDALQVTDSFYVLHLSGTEPARPLSIEEAKGKIVESLKAERLKEMVATKGAEIAQKMREAMKTGTPVEAAAQQAGATLEKIPPFSLADAPPPKPEAGKPAPAETPDLPLIKRAVSELSAGEVSDVVPTPSGAVIAILEKREAPDPIAFEAGKGMLATQALSGKREVAFYEWMRERRREAGVQPTAG